MKTSNKLLIAFGVLMFVVPLTIMAYTINRDYKDPEEIKEQGNANSHFNSHSNGFTSIALKETFKSISITGKVQNMWYVNLVNDQDYGVKVSEIYKDFVKVSIDANEQLHITMNEGFKDVMYPIAIYVYAPKIETLNLAGVDAVTLTFKNKTDALQLNAKDVMQLTMESDFKVNHLSIDAEKVNNMVFGGAELKSLNLNLKSSRFKSEMKSFNSLNVSASDGSELSIFGDEQSKARFAIEQLTLNTSGKVDVNLTDMKLNNVSGTLSDETMINVPVVYLKQLIK
ncbi:GIN domain-containing protein [Pedobacter panaciterrae]